MARRNRKRKQHGTILPVPFGGIVVLLSTLAIGYVWLDCRCAAIGTEIKTLEKERDELHKKCLNEKCRWATLKSPPGIEAALKAHHLRMGLPRRDQIVVVRNARPDKALPSERAAALDGIRGVVMNE